MEEKNLVTKVGNLVQADERSGGMTAQSARAVAEVQGAMAIAKRFPRDENTAYDKIMKSCERKSLAESAVYEFPRGGTKVTGPSIRLAEMMAQNWGNIDTGIVELERRAGESTAMAYCVDLETNYRKTVVFSVPHERKAGQKLADPRDIYETVMNNGSRRLRNCILAVIPGDIADAAVEKCEGTLRGGSSAGLNEKVQAMLAALSEFGVTSDMVEKKLGNNVAAITENQVVSMRRIYVSLKDGMAKVADYFEAPKGPSAGEALAEQLKARVQTVPKPKV